MSLLIGLNGYKRTGKDTAADYLVENYGFQKLSFAYSMKRALATLLGIHTPIVDNWKERNDVVFTILGLDSRGIFPQVLSQPATMREMLQRMGTEVGREQFGENFWVDQLLPIHTRPGSWDYDINHFDKPTVITDARFDNELERLLIYGAKRIRIERPGCEPDGHASEVAPHPGNIDYTINNDGAIEDLYAKVEEVLSGL